MNKLEQLLENLDDQQFQLMENNCKASYDKVNAIYTTVVTLHPELAQIMSFLDGAYGERQMDMGTEYMRYALRNI